jgi:glyoxylase-like metal-dependent hydrolase (beta-lactamase superfamily II)
MMRRAFGECSADGLIEDGEMQETALGPMRAVHTPGHAAGHLCFHFPERKLLISGDQLVEHHAPYIEYEPGSLERYRRSLQRLAGLDIEWVMPAHGLPFRNHRNHIQMLLTHCRRKSEEIRSAKARMGKCPHDLAVALWGEPANPFHLRCAVLEVLAYCESPGRQGSAEAS